MSEHWCAIHEAVFFKKGKMRGYAHPVQDTAGNDVGWCNEDGEPEPIPEEHKAEIAAKASEIAPQELGMWWKELGNRIGDGSLEKDYPKAHVKIRVQYYKKLSEVTGVSFKE